MYMVGTEEESFEWLDVNKSPEEVRILQDTVNVLDLPRPGEVRLMHQHSVCQELAAVMEALRGTIVHERWFCWRKGGNIGSSHLEDSCVGATELQVASHFEGVGQKHLKALLKFCLPSYQPDVAMQHWTSGSCL